ncbi:hypothetical protein A8F94_00700 [Bacillus sp. FJAT-27225]|uniref:hypothetical protein n=1 Tax=Bacillus sp. FJAT-27225 TaxID=1743144 RepID=UPI00080C2338|nr:hypothetical protein [Bacillus sp. FJAT-27225]OCA90443.1 hypothetical protein A8F94_00700 [Bacillus sp. FJAT-27225]
METKLKYLRKSMNQTVLKPGNMNSDQKSKLFHAVLDTQEYKRSNYFAPVLSTVLVVSFTLFFGAFILQNMLGETNHTEKENAANLLASEGSKDIPLLTEEQTEAKDEGQPDFPYIIKDGYYFKKIEKEAMLKHIGLQAGTIQEGDSNVVPPGPIYHLRGTTDNHIAAKGISYKNGTKQEAYLVFKKYKKVTEVNMEQ